MLKTRNTGASSAVMSQIVPVSRRVEHLYWKLGYLVTVYRKVL